MSFALDIKNELIKTDNNSICCMKAELCGIICFSAGVLYQNGKTAVKISTESEAAARRCLSLIKKIFGGNDELTIGKSKAGRGSCLYTIALQSGEDADAVLRGLYLYDEEFENNISFRIRDELFKCSNCKRAFLRGAFLGGGTAANPEKSYHIELSTHYHKLAGDTAKLLQEFELSPKTTIRKSSHVIYLKGGDEIADFLGIIGAFGAMMELTNIKIEKETNNDFNRAINCDMANTEKTIGAAIKQIMDIEKIKNAGKFESLPKPLMEAAKLRVENRDMSLENLGKLLKPPLSKSGIAHRFKKISEIAEETENNGEDK